MSGFADGAMREIAKDEILKVLSKMKSELDKLKKENAELKQQRQDHDAVPALKAQIAGLNEEVQLSSVMRLTLEEEVERLKAANNGGDGGEATANARDRAERKSSQARRARADLETAKATIFRMADEKAKLENQVDALKRETSESAAAAGLREDLRVLKAGCEATKLQLTEALKAKDQAVADANRLRNAASATATTDGKTPEISALEAKLDSMTEQLLTAKSNESELSAKLADASRRLESSVDGDAGAERDLARAECVELAARVEALTHEADEASKFSRESLKRVRQESSDQAGVLKTRVAEMEDSASHLEKETARLKSRIAELEGDAGEKCAREVETLKVELERAADETKERDARLQRAEAEEAALQTRVAELELAVSEGKERVAELERIVSEKTERVVELQSAAAELERIVSEKTERVVELESAAAVANTEAASELAALKTRVAELEHAESTVLGLTSEIAELSDKALKADELETTLSRTNELLAAMKIAQTSDVKRIESLDEARKAAEQRALDSAEKIDQERSKARRTMEAALEEAKEEADALREDLEAVREERDAVVVERDAVRAAATTEADDRVKALSAERDAALRSARDLKIAAGESQTRISILEQERSELLGKVDNVFKQLAEEQAAIAELKSTAESLRGERDGVKARCDDLEKSYAELQQSHLSRENIADEIAASSKTYEFPWRFDDSFSNNPPPPLDIHSPVIQELLNAWTDQADHRVFLTNWADRLLGGENVFSPNAQAFQRGIELESMSRSVKDGFDSLVLPLLKASRTDLKFTVSSRLVVEPAFDLRLRVDPR